MPRIQHSPHTAGAPALPMGPVPRREDALSAPASAAHHGLATGAGEAQANPPPQAAPVSDDWLRCAMAHWLENDAPVAFARMGDGH